MPICPPEYCVAVKALSPVLNELPGKIVGIDGRDVSGKTTLGRYLAWHFNVSLIETDLFLVKNRRGPKYKHKEINRIISERLSIPRPVIIEGIALLRLFKNLKREPDFLVVACNKNFDGSDTLSQMLHVYEKAYCPKNQAKLILEMSH
jgi:hypothetical protein